MASTNIQRTLGQNSNSGKLTISVWVKRAGFGEQGICGSWYSGAYHGILYFNSNDQITFYDYRNSYIMRKITTAQFRDVGAWYHIVCNFDHTLGSPTGKIYVNGVEQTLSTNVNYTQGAESSWLTDYSFNIGTYSGSGAYFNGNMSDFYFIQGYVYEASTFGETDATTGIWKPITEPTVDYSSTGNNSCHLKFENLANMDLDSGDNNVSFTTTGNLTQTVDTPSNNFPTFNVLVPSNNQLTFQNGNLYFSDNSNNNWASTPATLGVTRGKWYWEFKDEQAWGTTADSTRRYGICDYNTIPSTLGTAADVRYSETTSAYAYMNASGVRHNGSTIAGTTSTYPTFSPTDIIQVAMDLDNYKLYFGKNGTWLDSSNPTTGTNPVATLSSTAIWSPYVETKYGSDNVSANFGNGYFKTTAVASAGSNGNGAIFEFDCPNGYYALNTRNINTYG